jgi:hypothetical protein
MDWLRINYVLIMAHFAELDQNNIVLRVIVVNNADTSVDGHEIEAKGIAFCQSLFGADTRWVQTSYNGKTRKRYAGVGYSYDQQRDAFIPPQPYPSWALDAETCDWVAPIPMPNDGDWYMWDEPNQSWVKVTTDVPSV